MATTLGSTGITFPDGTIQTTKAVSGGGLGGMQIFTSSGTFTVPSGVTKIRAEINGGGGAAGGFSGRGGGGGGWRLGFFTVTPGANMTVTIGAGGASAYNQGGSGGQTSFNGMLANGGSGSDQSNGGAGGSSSGGTFGSSGTNGRGGNYEAMAAGTSRGMLGGPYTVVPGSGSLYGGGGGGTNPSNGQYGNPGAPGVCVIEW